MVLTAITDTVRSGLRARAELLPALHASLRHPVREIAEEGLAGEGALRLEGSAGPMKFPHANLASPFEF